MDMTNDDAWDDERPKDMIEMGKGVAQRESDQEKNRRKELSDPAIRRYSEKVPHELLQRKING